MINSNDNCNPSPVQNLVYESESCFYAQGRDIKNVFGIGTTGFSLAIGKFNDMVGLYNLINANPSIGISLNTTTRALEFQVPISADPGNTLSVQPDGLYSSASGAPPDFISPFLLMGG